MLIAQSGNVQIFSKPPAVVVKHFVYYIFYLFVYGISPKSPEASRGVSFNYREDTSLLIQVVLLLVK